MAEPTYRERLREDAVSISVRLVEAEGLDALQARRIAKEVGCAVGSLYNVFGDIDGLIFAVNGVTLKRLGHTLNVASRAAEQKDARERLLALALAYAEFAVRNGNAWDAIFKHRRASGTVVPASYVEEQMRLIALIEGVIGDDSPDEGAKGRRGRALFGAVHGVLSLAMDDRLGGIARTELDTQIRFIVDVIARGLAVPAAK